VREVDDDAGEETGFGDAEQKPHNVELHRRTDKCRASRNQAPSDENSREPFARAPSFDEECTGNFQREIAEEEDADAQAEDFVGELQVAGHAQLGEADIGPVEISHQIKKDHQRHDAPGDFASQHSGPGGIEGHLSAPRRYHIAPG
jgi:hypothetical protein